MRHITKGASSAVPSPRQSGVLTWRCQAVVSMGFPTIFYVSLRVYSQVGIILNKFLWVSCCAGKGEFTSSRVTKRGSTLISISRPGGGCPGPTGYTGPAKVYVVPLGLSAKLIPVFVYSLSVVIGRHDRSDNR